MEIGDRVKVLDIGDEEIDLMCSGFHARITIINDANKRAYINSDALGELQATSFSGWWPMSALIVEPKANPIAANPTDGTGGER